MPGYKFTLETRVGKYEVKIDQAAKYGYFENVANGGEGGLWFGQKEGQNDPTILEITDYDGYAYLPKPVIEALEGWSIHLDESFK